LQKKYEIMNQANRHIDFDEPAEMQGESRPTATGDAPGESAGKNGAPAAEPQKFRIKELLDGTVLVRDNMIKQLPYVLFLTMLGIIYIGNRFHAERMVRQINMLKTEVTNLRAEQITTTSELMNISRPSEVAELVESRNMGLKESMEPPKKLKRR
jgi:Bacteriodetes cell division protein (FtsL-like)